MKKKIINSNSLYRFTRQCHSFYCIDNTCCKFGYFPVYIMYMVEVYSNVSCICHMCFTFFALKREKRRKESDRYQIVYIRIKFPPPLVLFTNKS